MRFKPSWLILLAVFCASPSLAQEREWKLDATDEDAFLIFGTPETDDVGISFWCKIGSKRAKIFLPETHADLVPGSKMELAIEVGGKKFDVPAKVAANEEAGIPSVEAELAVDDGLFAAIQTADFFSVMARSHKTSFPTAGSEFEDLLKLCRMNPAELNPSDLKQGGGDSTD